jgi:hypothetical protein
MPYWGRDDSAGAPGVQPGALQGDEGSVPEPAYTTYRSEHVGRRTRRALITGGWLALLIGGGCGYLRSQPALLRAWLPGIHPDWVPVLGMALIGLLCGAVVGLWLRGVGAVLRLLVAILTLLIGLSGYEIVRGVLLELPPREALTRIGDATEAFRLGVGLVAALLGIRTGRRRRQPQPLPPPATTTTTHPPSTGEQPRRAAGGSQPASARSSTQPRSARVSTGERLRRTVSGISLPTIRLPQRTSGNPPSSSNGSSGGGLRVAGVRPERPRSALRLPPLRIAARGTRMHIAPRASSGRSRGGVRIPHRSAASIRAAAIGGRRAGSANGVSLGGDIVDVCPYCLEEVTPNDPRGVVVCEICGTPHHADCWAITGKCEVPHLQT